MQLMALCTPEVVQVAPEMITFIKSLIHVTLILILCFLTGVDTMHLYHVVVSRITYLFASEQSSKAVASARVTQCSSCIAVMQQKRCLVCVWSGGFVALSGCLCTAGGAGNEHLHVG